MGLMFRTRGSLTRLAAGAAVGTEASRGGAHRHAVTEERLTAPDITSEIERLVALQVVGMLTDAEFTAAKAKLLGL
jgi:hypothetical protein